MKDFVVSLFPYTPEQARGTSFFLSVYDCHGGPQLLAKKGQGWWFSTEVVGERKGTRGGGYFSFTVC